MAIQVTLNNFFGVEVNKIELSRFMIFCGDNGSGKTHLVKALNSFDEFLRNPNFFGSIALGKDDLNNFPINLDLNNLINGGGSEFIIKSESDSYAYLVYAANKLIKLNKDNILSNTFSNIEDILDDISIKFTHNPDIKIKISCDLKENNKKEQSDDDLYSNEEESVSFTFNFETDNEELSTGIRFVGMSFQNLIKDSAKRDKFLKSIIHESLITGLIRVLYRSNFNLTNHDKFYFPASREAYMRDFSYFFGNNRSSSRSVVVQEYDIENERKEKINMHSNDPYIENYVKQMIKVVENSDKYNDDLIDFIEKKFLKVKIQSFNNTHKYLLENDKVISTDLGSSLQNEYSFLRILIGRRDNPNIVIEEPEAHLSIKNSVLLAYILVSLHQKKEGKIWITTHSNFVVDAINNLIMLASLDSEIQKTYLDKLGMIDVLTNIDKSKTDEIVSYFLIDGFAEKLPRNVFGIEYDSFVKQINDFVDLSTDLQWEVENLNDVLSEE